MDQANLHKLTTAQLIDANGQDKADISDLSANVKARDALLLERLGAGESGDGEFYEGRHVHQTTKTTAWRSMAERLASSQMIVANTKRGTKDFMKYTARKA